MILLRGVATHVALPVNFVEDASLGPDHLAVLLWLYTRPEGYRCHVRVIRERMGWGRDKTYGVVNGLIDHGYLHKKEIRDEGGTVAGIYYILTDHVMERQPAGVMRGPGRLPSESLDAWKKRMFDSWWDLYGRKVNRRSALSTWLKLSQENINKILDHTPAYVANTPEIQFRAHPTTYLRREYWQTPVEDLTGGKPVRVSAAEAQRNMQRRVEKRSEGLSPREWLLRQGFSEDEIAGLTTD